MMEAPSLQQALDHLHPRRFAEFWFEPTNWVFGVRIGYWRCFHQPQIQIGPFGVTFNTFAKGDRT